MSLSEKHNQPGEGHHFNPAVVEWDLPHEGLDIRLHIDHVLMETLGTESREQMMVAVSRFAMLCEYMVVEQERIAVDGLVVENSFKLLAMSLQDLNYVFQTMAGDVELSGFEGIEIDER